MSLLFFEYEPSDAETLLMHSFNAYKAGLIESGWGKYAELAYLGCMISITLWPGLVLPSYAHWYTEIDPFRASAEALFGRSEKEMVAGWARISEFCMDCADQARHIMHKLIWL